MAYNKNPFNNANLEPKDLFLKLKNYYDNNGLYDDIQSNSQLGTWVEAMKPLRTCVNRSVEFFVSKLLPNYQITTQSPNLKTTIEQMLLWSNFKSQSKVAIRNDALDGNLFWKINSDGEKVWFEIIDPSHITIFKTDNRGFITEIRIDIPVVLDNDQNGYHTEYYNKEYWSIWESTQNNPQTAMDQLVGLVDYGFLSEIGTDNFVPFVHVKFRDLGEKYGVGCTVHALDKIDEANREATRLTQMLFKNNKAHWIVSANATDKDNRPLPPPKIKKGNIGSNDSELKDESVIYLPGMSQMQSLVPNIQYDAALNILNAQLKELTEDLPELKYFALSESQLSSKAIRLMLAGAIDRANEARENIIDGLIRVIQMGLTVGSFWGLWSVGTWENGDFDFSITAGEIFPASEDEKATILKMYTDAGLPLQTAMRKAGFNEEEILQTITERNTEDQRKTEMASQNLANAMSSFNSGVQLCPTNKT